MTMLVLNGQLRLPCVPVVYPQQSRGTFTTGTLSRLTVRVPAPPTPSASPTPSPTPTHVSSASVAARAPLRRSGPQGTLEEVLGLFAIESGWVSAAG
jgi:hypothetical protein